MRPARRSQNLTVAVSAIPRLDGEDAGSAIVLEADHRPAALPRSTTAGDPRSGAHLRKGRVE